MESPNSIIKLLFPKGTLGDRKGVLNHPRWPVDLFGATAYLLQISDRYTYLLREGNNIVEKSDILIEIGRDWRTSTPLGMDRVSKNFIQKQWRKIVDTKTAIASRDRDEEWVHATLSLFIIADEACEGIGFYNENRQNSWVQMLHHFLNQNRIGLEMIRNHREKNWWREALNSNLEAKSSAATEVNTACIQIPSSILCVQPKTRSPSVGCTLRSLSHHLALLPGCGQIEVLWNSNPYTAMQDRKPFNVLVIPYPFEINGNDFVAITRNEQEKYGYFDVNQNWLKNSAQSCGFSIIDETVRLIKEAKKHVAELDMVLFPELALDQSTYDRLIEAIGEKIDGGISLVIAGLRKQTGNTVTNVAKTHYKLKHGGICVEQKKHHRWKLDQGQITTYSMGDGLDPNLVWWEKIDIQRRLLDFVVFAPGACFTTLICEDLARVDPCQTAIRSIGPNLVFALLMDGPQIKGRWPERYALSLADDPGCSVLSVTSLGMVKRSNHHFNSKRCAIALWKDSETGTTEIELPQGHSSVLLNLSSKRQEEFTLDGRSDGGTAVNWVLTGKIPLQ